MSRTRFESWLPSSGPSGSHANWVRWGVEFLSRQELETAVQRARSYSEALRNLGYRVAGGNHATVKKYAELWEISTDHASSMRPRSTLCSRDPTAAVDRPTRPRAAAAGTTDRTTRIRAERAALRRRPPRHRAFVSCLGEGRKQRIPPVTRSTVAVLRTWLRERRASQTIRVPHKSRRPAKPRRARAPPRRAHRSRRARLSVARREARHAARAAPHGSDAAPASARRHLRHNALAWACARRHHAHLPQRRSRAQGTSARQNDAARHHTRPLHVSLCDENPSPPRTSPVGLQQPPKWLTRSRRLSRRAAARITSSLPSYGGKIAAPARGPRGAGLDPSVLPRTHQSARAADDAHASRSSACEARGSP